MSLQERNRFAENRVLAEAEVAFPAVVHFRIIVQPEIADLAKLKAVVSEYRVTAPLTESRQSATGRFFAYSLSVHIDGRDELNSIDAAIKGVAGVRMVL